MKKTLLSLCLGALCSLFAIAGSANGNISGKVTSSDGTPLAGVVVSDGFLFTQTASDGSYSLDSKKQYGYVFVCLPSGYEPQMRHGQPAFWQTLESKDITLAETHDFCLNKVRNDNFYLVVGSDMHLAGRHNDREQFCSKVVPHFRELKKTHSDRPIYMLNTGDQTFDIYWYCDNYGIEDFEQTWFALDWPIMTFMTNGNHDHDGATPCYEGTDFESLQRYNRVLGPADYSLNIGKWHVIMLDNIVYLNEPGGKISKGIVGARNYKHGFADRTRQWLLNDLKYVSKDTPIILGMHAPAFRNAGMSYDPEPWCFSEEDCQFLKETFKDFPEVHFVSGHAHKTYTTYVNDVITDHNIGAVCGTWWQAGNLGRRNVSNDGVPTSYALFTMDGKKIKWELGTFDFGLDKFFWTYDMNEVRRVWSEDQWYIDYVKKTKGGEYNDFSTVEDNMIYVNVWGWDAKCKIEIYELQGRKKVALATEKIKTNDPIYIATYDYAHYVAAKNKYTAYKDRVISKMFAAKASSATSTIIVKVTDPFGKVYTETMQRPKAFYPNME